MNLRRILALATRIVHQFRRDRRTLFLLFVVPVLVLSLLAWIYRGDGASPVTLAIVNEGQSPLAAQIVTGLQEDASLTVREMDAAAAMRAATVVGWCSARRRKRVAAKTSPAPRSSTVGTG